MSAPMPERELAAPPADASPIPVEARGRGGSWLARCVRTLLGVTTSPNAMFARCPEPVDHARTLKYLATLRFVPWVLLVTWLAAAYILDGEPTPVPTRPIHAILDPAMADALATWLLLMVPVGMPLLYFCGGLVAHTGVALTGGAARSIGASMRAVGYALGPALLGIGLFDIPLYTLGLDARIYFAGVIATGAAFYYVAAVALARTHQIHLGRGFVVACLPMVMLMAVTLARGALSLDGEGLESILPAPANPYWVP